MHVTDQNTPSKPTNSIVKLSNRLAKKISDDVEYATLNNIETALAIVLAHYDNDIDQFIRQFNSFDSLMYLNLLSAVKAEANQSTHQWQTESNLYVAGQSVTTSALVQATTAAVANEPNINVTLVSEALNDTIASNQTTSTVLKILLITLKKTSLHQ